MATDHTERGDDRAIADQRLERVHTLTSAGLTLETVRQLLPCTRGPQAAFEICAESDGILRNRIANIDNRQRALEQHRRALNEFWATRLRGRRTPRNAVCGE
jgi:DNA-binding transcriptional MerR regulator